MSPRWEVHVSADAEAEMRELSRSAADEVARVLDDIAVRGPATADLEHRRENWSGRVVAGDYVLLVAGRTDDRRVVVVRVESREDAAQARFVEALPIRIAARRRLAAVWRGFGLDVRYTARALRRSRLFTVVVVGTLAVGFGGGTALLDVVYTTYRGALPFGDGERLVRIRNASVTATGEVRLYNVTPSDFTILRENNRVFSEVIGQAGRSLSLVGDGFAERVSAIGVSPRWAQTLRLQPIVGRGFTRDEEELGTDAEVGLISFALWQRRFGGDSSVVGQSLRFDGGAITIVGVMPRGFSYPYDADVWTPWTFRATDVAPSSLNVVARLSPGVALPVAQSDADRVHRARTSLQVQGTATGFNVATVRADFIRDEARILQALTAAVLFLLVLACVNVTNLLVSRFAARRAELGVRAALGGRRDQQLRQMVIESMVLFLAGGVGGLVLSSWLRRLLEVTIPSDLRTQLGFGDVSMGTGIAAVGLGLGTLCGLIVGGAAALRAVRTDVATLVKAGGRASFGARDRRAFDVLVVSQLALSMVLLVGASLLIGRFRDLSLLDQGYDLRGVSTMHVTIEQDRYRGAESRYQLVKHLEDELRNAPGVRAVGMTTVNPLCCGNWGAPVEAEGRPVGPDDAPTLVAHSYVTPGYFSVMSIPMVRGSPFASTDRPGGPLSVVIDEAFGRTVWPGEDPVGRRVRVARPGEPWRTVQGVVPITDHEAEMRASWFLPYYQDPTGRSTDDLHIMVRGAGAIDMDALRGVVQRIDPGLATYGVTTMDALQGERLAQDRLGAVVSTVFATFGLLLAGFSLYGLLSYSIELRSSEIGIRMALGASRRRILDLVLRQAFGRLVIGAAAGVALALALNQFLRSAVEGLGWVSWAAIIGLVGLLTVITAVAAIVPALRAARMDPIACLRG